MEGSSPSSVDDTKITTLEHTPTFTCSLIIITVVVGFCGYYWIWKNRKNKTWSEWFQWKESYQLDETLKNTQNLQSKQKSTNRSKKNQKSIEPSSNVIEDKGIRHPLYIATLKGFSHDVKCVSINRSGTKIVVASSDSSIRVFTSDPNSPILSLQKQSYVRGVINGDYCTAVDLSCDDQFIFGATELSCKLVKLAQTKSVTNTPIFEQVVETPKPIHKNSVRWLSSSKGQWIVTASDNEDTDVKIFSYSLYLLASIDTKQVKNLHLGVSPMDGRYFGIAAWSPGVKVMEIVSQRQGGEFKKIEKAMDLGSTCGVNALGFSPDSTKAVLACKDGTLILWNINVRYQASEDPKKILTVKEELTSEFKGYSQLQFSCDGSMIIGVFGKSIKILRTSDLSVIETIEDAHAVPIRSLSVSPTGNFFATGAVDSRPRVWQLPSIRPT